MSTVIEISNLTKLGFLAPNGAVGSVTMSFFTGYLSKARGRVSVCGFDILEKLKEAKKRIGYLPE